MGSNSTLDPWEAVFAMAQGHESVTLDGPFSGKSSGNNADHCQSPPSRVRKRRRNNTRNNGGSASTHYRGSKSMPPFFREYLQQRGASDVCWPSWLTLGAGFDSAICPSWDNADGDLTTFDNSPSSAASTQVGTCRRCGLSSTHHLTSVKEEVFQQCGNNKHLTGSSAPVPPPLLLFCALRNLRSAALNVAITKDFRLSKRTFRLLRQDWDNSLTAFQGNLHSSSDCLATACHQVAPLINKSLECRSRHDNSVHEPALRLIMACDDVYFQLYYAEITRQLPLSARASTTTTPHLVPHPLSYFGLIAVDVKHSFQDLPLRMESSLRCADANVHSRLMHQFGLFNGRKGQQEPTLSLLHSYRLAETFCLLHESAATLRSETLSQLRDVQGRHDTPAPRILMEWRDHCRDFLCHLYSYATVSRATLNSLAETLAKCKIQKILELGAGNGYLAHILAQSRAVRVDVVAFDLQPPDVDQSSNEYHGNTPSYTHVEQGTEAILQSYGGNLSQSALLLCYPPPCAPFAHQALEIYTERGGQILVYIGEFKGLTGNDAFERFLVNNYDCILRLPTLCWGTDASTVSVWKRLSKERGALTRALLLPCTLCGTTESIKRCRLLRSLTYCSKTCFRKDEQVLLAALKSVMIDLPEGQLDFDCPHHFSNL